MGENKLIKVTSPATWSHLQVLFESGEYPNLKSLYDHVKDKYPDMPSLWDLRERCGAEGWDKERFYEITTEVKRRNMAELYAELGMDEREQARYRVECVKAVDDIKSIIGKLYSCLDKLDPNGIEFNETLGKIKVLSDTMFKGMGTSLSALQDISKLAGDYAPEKTKEVKSHGFKTKEGLKAIDDMTEEEILQDLKRMERAGITFGEIEDSKPSPNAQGGTNGP